jgi:deoxyribonuclease-1
MEVLDPIARAHVVEAEHIFPASQFGNFRVCWREPETVCGDPNISGRDCCLATDPLFRSAHNDLMNLAPANGYVNGQRSDYNWGMIDGELREYGVCDFETDSTLRRAEPADAVRGDIARSMLYMSEIYGFNLSDQDKQLYVSPTI